ncbi:MAG: glycosyltransferase family 4 protein [Algoriphagus aquaeductus]|uniref:glycosyltransferase family 4 protein n=1 Tax=Algoriphagus aquaeductus TaxID=475299 RepID=UPI00391CC259
MRILFVSSQNSLHGLSPIVTNQGDSLKKINLIVNYFGIKGKGIIGYLKNVSFLRRKIRSEKYDVIHAHYSFSGIVSVLSSLDIKIPIVVSLMGSDIKSSVINRFFILLFGTFFWDKIIVKSDDSKVSINSYFLKNKIIVLPNGVNFDKFFPMDIVDCKKILGLYLNKKYILFGANPARPEKNFNLAKKSFELIRDENLELIFLKNIPSDLVPIYINASSVVILSSFWEGSPNIIKEALACNRPIVSTNCGDVRINLEGIEGCFVVYSLSPEEMANKIKKSLTFESTNSRNHILHLDDIKIATKLQLVYKSLIN